MFKNARVYRVHQDAISAAELHDCLLKMKFKNAGPFEARRIGFSSAAGKDAPEMILSISGMHLVKFTEQVKILPSSVVKERVQEECDNIEGTTGMPPTRKERQAIKEQIVELLLPQAFYKTDHTFLIWDTNKNLIIIDASSEKKATSALDALRMSIGSLKVTPFAVREPISRTITGWLTEPSKRELDITIGDRVQLRGNDDGVIAARYMDLDSNEIQAALSEGRRVSKMSIHIEGQMSCMLHEDFTIKQIAFDDALIDEVNDQSKDQVSSIDSELAIFGSSLSESIIRLANALGGEQEAAVATSFTLEQE